MKLILAGDSWGIGVYSDANGTYEPTGEGIEQLLIEQKYDVANISKAGCTNQWIVSRLKYMSYSRGEVVVFIQTDPFRDGCYFENDLKKLKNEFINQLVEFSSLKDFFDDYYNKLYNKLSLIETQILCIGGWSPLHPSVANYDNLVEVIPSASKLLLPTLDEDTYISDFEWIEQLNNHKPFMRKHGKEFKELALKSSDKFDLMCKTWNDVHPNLAGYQTITKELVKKL